MKALKKLIVSGVLLLLSLTLFGQGPNKIRPVKRYIENGDTFTVFTFQGERELAARVASDRLCQQNNKTLEDAFHSSEEARSIQDSTLLREREKSKNLGGIIKQDSIMRANIEIAYNSKSAESKKFKRQRNKALSLSGVITAIATILILL